MTAAQQPPRDAAPRRRLLLLLLLAPCVGSAVVRLKPDSAPALQVVTERPALVFETYLADSSQYEAESRPVITEEFHFRNQGRNPVQIIELKPSCGCLAPQASSPVIEPGATGRITLPVRTANEPAGFREYMVNVRYNDPQPREVTLTCRMLLPEKKLLIEPRVVMVMGQPAADATYNVNISDFREGRAQQPIQIARIEATPFFIQASLAGQSTGSELSQTRLNIHFTSDQPPGQHRGLVSVFTSDPDYPVIQIPVVSGSRSSGAAPGENNRPPDAPRARSAPEMGRIVVNRNAVSQSAGSDLQITAPTDWTPGTIDCWPAQLNANITPVPADDKTEPQSPEQHKFRLTIGLSDLPPAGLQQAVLTLHFSTPAGPRILTVPLSFVWL
ncbi:MAG: DUF1573 domain-containing protein [Planctomycetaceae bacterium]